MRKSLKSTIYLWKSFRTIKTILLEVIKHCVYDLRRRGLMKTYHYLFEPRVDEKPGLEVLFRVEAKEKVGRSHKRNGGKTLRFL